MIKEILDYIYQHEQELSELAREGFETYGHGAVCAKLEELPSPTLRYLPLDRTLPGGSHADNNLAQVCRDYNPEEEFVFVAFEQAVDGGTYAYLPTKHRLLPRQR